MALTATTLASPVSVTDTAIIVASATGFAPGMFVRMDAELGKVTQGYVAGNTTVPILRGQEGTATATHPVNAKVLVETAVDLGVAAPQTTSQILSQPAYVTRSYSANGTIALPAPGTNGMVYLNGTSVLTMTLPNPTADMDGSRLLIVGNGKAAHVINYTAGLGGAGTAADVITGAAGAQSAIELVAAGGFWCQIGVGFTAA